MSEALKTVADVANNSPGLKAAATAVGTGGATTMVNTMPDYVTLIALMLTFIGILVSIGSLWLGYQNMKLKREDVAEQRRMNDLKEAEIGSNSYPD